VGRLGIFSGGRKEKGGWRWDVVEKFGWKKGRTEQVEEAGLGRSVTSARAVVNSRLA